jgi:hypothetical protein
MATYFQSLSTLAVLALVLGCATVSDPRVVRPIGVLYVDSIDGNGNQMEQFEVARISHIPMGKQWQPIETAPVYLTVLNSGAGSVVVEIEQPDSAGLVRAELAIGQSVDVIPDGAAEGIRISLHPTELPAGTKRAPPGSEWDFDIEVEHIK